MDILPHPCEYRGIARFTLSYYAPCASHFREDTDTGSENRGVCEQLEAEWQLRGASSVGEESEVADAHQSAWQEM